MRYGADYYRLKKVRDVLSRIICDQKTPARDVPRCVTALISLERFIREMRGIPPLAPMSVKELMEMKRQHGLKRLKTITMPIEARESPNHANETAVPRLSGAPSAKTMAGNSPASAPEAYSPDNSYAKDTFQTGDTNNHHANPGIPQKVIPPKENFSKQQPPGRSLKKPPIYLGHYGVSINGS
jgi:hypothetical protein